MSKRLLETISGKHNTRHAPSDIWSCRSPKRPFTLAGSRRKSRQVLHFYTQEWLDDDFNSVVDTRTEIEIGECETFSYTNAHLVFTCHDPKLSINYDTMKSIMDFIGVKRGDNVFHFGVNDIAFPIITSTRTGNVVFAYDNNGEENKHFL